MVRIRSETRRNPSAGFPRKVVQAAFSPLQMAMPGTTPRMDAGRQRTRVLLPFRHLFSRNQSSETVPVYPKRTPFRITQRIRVVIRYSSVPGDSARRVVANSARRDLDRRSFQHGPAGRFRQSQFSRIRRREPESPIRPRGHRTRGPQSLVRARDNRHRKILENPAPVIPKMEPDQVVGSHDPDEPDPRIHRSQCVQGFRRESGSQFKLEVGHQQSGMRGTSACRRQPLRNRRRRVPLERIARRDQPPDPIEPAPFQCLQRDVKMAGMRRIE